MVQRSKIVLTTLLLVAVVAQASTWISVGKGLHGAPAFVASSATFDGSGDRIRFTSSAVTMSGAGKVISISFWISFDTTTGAQVILMGRNAAGGPLWRVQLNGANIEFLFQNSSSSTVISAFGNGGFTTGWHHVAISINTAAQSNTRMYVDGTDYLNDYNSFTTDGILALDRDSLYIGNDDDNATGINGCLAEVWIDDSYVDFSSATERAKFRSGTGHPVDLGSTGSIPTGTAPDLYMRFVSGSLGVNSGADGGTGTLDGNVANGDCGTP